MMKKWMSALLAALMFLGTAGPAFAADEGREAPPPAMEEQAQPASGEMTVPEEVPVTEEAPTPEEAPAPEEAPTPEETPVQEETPVTEEAPVPEVPLLPEDGGDGAQAASAAADLVPLHFFGQTDHAVLTAPDGTVIRDGDMVDVGQTYTAQVEDGYMFYTGYVNDTCVRDGQTYTVRFDDIALDPSVRYAEAAVERAVPVQSAGGNEAGVLRFGYSCMGKYPGHSWDTEHGGGSRTVVSWGETVPAGTVVLFDLDPGYELQVENGTILDDWFDSAYYSCGDTTRGEVLFSGSLSVYRYCTVMSPDSGTMTVRVVPSDDVQPSLVPLTEYNLEWGWKNEVVLLGGFEGSETGFDIDEDGIIHDYVNTGGEYDYIVKNGYEIQVLKGGYVAGTSVPTGMDWRPDSTKWTLHVDVDAEEFVIVLLKKGDSFQLYEQNTLPFTDVSEKHWYYMWVKKAYEQGIIKGVSDTSFAPAGTVTRLQAITMLYRLAGSPDMGAASPFTDIAAGEMAKAAAWGAANGIIRGVGGGRFDPNSPVTREQLIAMMHRMAGSPWDDSWMIRLDIRDDKSAVSGYAQKPIAWAMENGLVDYDSSNCVRPNQPLTRAETCHYIMRWASWNDFQITV